MRLLPHLLLIEVSDDGKGFDSKTFLNRDALETEQQMGLQAMRDRVREAGGTWEIHSTPGVGTTVRARFPLTSRTASTIPAMPVTALTIRERDVLRLVIDGLTNRAIAEQTLGQHRNRQNACTSHYAENERERSHPCRRPRH